MGHFTSTFHLNTFQYSVSSKVILPEEISYSKDRTSFVQEVRLRSLQNLLQLQFRSQPSLSAAATVGGAAA